MTSRACRWSVLCKVPIDVSGNPLERLSGIYEKSESRWNRAGCFHAAAPSRKKGLSGAVLPCKSRWRAGRQPGAAQTSPHAAYSSSRASLWRWYTGREMFILMLGIQWVTSIIRRNSSAACQSITVSRFMNIANTGMWNGIIIESAVKCHKNTGGWKALQKLSVNVRVCTECSVIYFGFSEKHFVSCFVGFLNSIIMLYFLYDKILIVL